MADNYNDEVVLKADIAKAVEKAEKCIASGRCNWASELYELVENINKVINPIEPIEEISDVTKRASR